LAKFQFVREYWYIAAVALLALWAVVAGSGIVVARRHPERVREGLVRLRRMFTD
jgi:hypothetical protein